MNKINIEIKCHVNDPQDIIDLLNNINARYEGEDNQIDTYFKVEKGRLKLREGNIENALVYYMRPESHDLKRSDVKIQYLDQNNDGLKFILENTFGIKTIVKKNRKIYYLDNVKFHVDEVKGLGFFVEIEACDMEGTFSEDILRKQCDHYIEYLKLNREKFINMSYSDMMEFDDILVMH